MSHLSHFWPSQNIPGLTGRTVAPCPHSVSQVSARSEIKGLDDESVAAADLADKPLKNKLPGAGRIPTAFEA